MDNKTVFVITLKGEGEIKNHTHHLSDDVKRVLTLVDDASTVEILARRAAPSLRAGLSDMLQKLENGGFIQDKANTRTSNMLRMATPKISAPAKNAEEAEEGDDLDFTSGMSEPLPAAATGEQAKAEVARLRSEQEAAAIRVQIEAAQAKMKADAKAHAEAEARAKQEMDTARRKAEQEAAQMRAEAEAVRIKTEQDAAKARAELEAARLETERARAELEAAKVKAEALAKREAETARLREKEAAAKTHADAEIARLKAEAEAKAIQEAEAARRKAEEEVAKARAEAEATRLKAAQVKAELEAARMKAEAEAQARAEAEARAKQETEAARLKTEQEAAKARAEAEATRLKAAQEAARVKAELEAARVKTEAEAQARAEAEARAKKEAEAARLKAEQEAAKARAEAEATRLKAAQETARVKAELEAAKVKAEAEAQARAEAEARAKQEAEAARLKAEQEAAKARAEAEATRLKAAQEAARVKAELEAAKVKAEAEAQARAEAEAARLKAEQEAAKARLEAEERAKREAEAARLNAEQEIARIKAEAEKQVRQATQAKADAESALAAKTKADASAARSMIATVLFFDVVDYTKQSVSKQIELKAQFNKLVSEFIKDIEENQRIILDTGDGAAIGFLQHPEDAIEVAQKFRQAVTANKHRDYPDLKVRIGIHLGPVNIVKDMNGQSNMVGDGINDAQRIMSFASFDQIYISRSYYDVVSRLNAEYAKLFQYRGVKNDKHGRQHQVYEATVDALKNVEPSGEQQESAPLSVQLEPFALNDFGQTATTASTQLPNITPEKIPVPTEQAAAIQEQPIAIQQEKVAQEQATPKMRQEIKVEAHASVEQKVRQEAEIAPVKTEQEAARANSGKDAHQMAEEQAKAWVEAEQRAKAQAATQAKVEHAVQPPDKTPQAKAAPPITHPVARVRRKPLPLGKIAASLTVLLLALIAALPYIWPMQDYVAQLEKKLSAQLQQPVHIAHMKAALLPLPKLELQDVSVGGAQELKAASVVLNFGMTALFAETKTIKTVEINDLALNADSFGQTLSWLQAAGGDAHYPVARMMLQRAHISGEGLSLPPVNGNVDWDAQGHFSKALLHSEDGKLDLELQALQSRWQIALDIKESRLPWLPGILFNELNVKGEIGEGTANLTEVDAHLYGGKLAGNAHLNWRSGWQMQGRLSIKAMELKEALPQFGLEGATFC
jgi:hypothetical protein